MSCESCNEPDRLLRLADVKERIGFGKTAIYEMIAAGTFPRPYKPIPGAARWSEREVDHWISGVTSGAAWKGHGNGHFGGGSGRATSPAGFGTAS